MISKCIFSFHNLTTKHLLFNFLCSVSPKRKFKIIPDRVINKIDRRLFWLLMGLITAISALILQFYPAFVEAIYSEGIFVGVRWVLDNTLGRLPFSIFYALIILVAGYIVFKVVKWIRFNLTNRTVPIKDRILYTLLSFTSFLGMLTFWFFLLWGFNYLRIPIKDKLGLRTVDIENISIIDEINYARKAAIESRKKLMVDKDPTYIITPKDLPKNFEDEIRENVEAVLKSMDYSIVGAVPNRFIKPDGFLNGLGISGFYNPFLGESNLDHSFSTIYLPFLMAHEMAHGYGFAREGEANFIAYLACEASTNPLYRYSGRLTYLLYLTHHLKEFEMKFPIGINLDIKRNGYFISQPMYDEMIVLVNAWRKNQPVKRILED